MPLPADDVKRRRFLWGVALAWIPFIILFSKLIVEVLRSASSNKATGLGAVAGGISEMFWIFGLIGTLVVEVSAIVLLVRAFSTGNLVRNAFAFISICVSAIMLVIFVGSAWMLFHLTH
jgi:hypothetical protein